MRDIWLSNCDCDQKVNDYLLNVWSKLCRDLEMLHTLEFKRSAVVDNQNYGLVIFCDSSQLAYGFVVLAVCKDPLIKPQFLFAKAKVSPVKQSYSILSLEFVSVILAIKYLNNILSGYKNIQFDYVTFAVDSQVVLQWLLKREPKTTSKFVKNRIVEFTRLSEEIQNRYKIPFFFKYVKSESNIADVVTRGVSFNNFKNNLNLYVNGPEFLNYDLQSWPVCELLSLAPEIRTQIINVNINNNNNDNNLEIIDISKYSSFRKVMKITYYIFKFLSKRGDNNSYEKAMKYWVTREQNNCFSNEITFLNDKNNKIKIPSLVQNPNMFFDNQALLRTRGRISKCVLYEYYVHN